MDIIASVVIILFVIDAILLILLVLMQNDQGDSLGSLFSGSSQTAFGSRSSNILIKITSVLAAIFFLGTVFIAFRNRPADIKSSEEAPKPWYEGPVAAGTGDAAAAAAGTLPLTLDPAATPLPGEAAASPTATPAPAAGSGTDLEKPASGAPATP